MGVGFGVWGLGFRVRRPWRRVGWENEVKTSRFPSLPPQNARGGGGGRGGYPGSFSMEGQATHTA